MAGLLFLKKLKQGMINTIQKHLNNKPSCADAKAMAHEEKGVNHGTFLSTTIFIDTTRISVHSGSNGAGFGKKLSLMVLAGNPLSGNHAYYIVVSAG
jgi:hypothetical protein